jgi:hypothetical protein
MRKPVLVSAGFLFVATGNNDNERGRIPLPGFILSHFTRPLVDNPNTDQLEGLIHQIIYNDDAYRDLAGQGIRPGQIRKFMERMSEILHIPSSLRSIRRFLRRASFFLNFEVLGRGACRDFSHIQPISTIAIALSFFFSGPCYDDEQMKEMIDQTVSIFNGSVPLSHKLRRADTKCVQFKGKHYLVRGHIAFPIHSQADFPQPALDTLFWTRWTGTPKDQTPHESVSLVGLTSYNAIILNFLFPSWRNAYHMTREIQVGELIEATKLT